MQLVVGDPIQQVIFNCLNNFAHQDAIFLAERLNSESQNEENLYLLSLCNYRSNRVLRAYNLLKNRYLTLPQSKYLLSKCCIDLNKYGEAETILTECTITKQKLYDEILKEYGDYSCFVLQLLANVYSKTDRIGQSIEFHKKCLRLNPFLWSSFEALCNFGEKLDPLKYFNLNQASNYYNTSIAAKMPQYQQTSSGAGLPWPMSSGGNGSVQSNKRNLFDVNTNTNGFCVSDLFALKEHPIIENDEQLCTTATTNSTNTSLTSLTTNNSMTNLKQSSMNMTTGGGGDMTIANSSELGYHNDSTQIMNSQDSNLIETTSTTTSATTTPPQSSNPPSQQTANAPSVDHHYPITYYHQSHRIIPAPPAKKPIQSKRIIPMRPLSGQNNNISSSSLSSSMSNAIRRSSRISAQNVKENKKTTTTTTSNVSSTSSASASTSSASSTSSTTSTNDSNNIISNRNLLKLKKKMSITSKGGMTSGGGGGGGLGSTHHPVNNDNDENQPSSNGTAQQHSHHQHHQHHTQQQHQVKQEQQHYLQQNNLINNSNQQIGQQQHQSLQQQSHGNNKNDMILSSLNIKLSQTSEDFIRGTLENTMKLFRDIGNGYSHLSQYECKKALDTLQQLKSTQYQSSYILSLVAKAYFEQHEYNKSEKVYLQLRHLHPYHLEGLEYYSTVLWHLQKEIQLSSLAQELTDYDKLAPETWCVVGNCFSLHKEHDAAIKFFQRATQINPNFVYAYNLLGHEYFLIEEMEKGLSCFRKAIFLDPRHFNAWYGISMIHLKQEKFLLAENYLKKALIINPYSSTLMCHIAVVYHSMKKSEKALEILDNAINIEPKNFLCKFHRASILFSLGKYEEALKDFERLRKQIPKESLIYYMISKTHKKLRNVHLSLMYMSWAMDLDPKGVNNQLKDNIDKRYVLDNDSTFARELEAISTPTLDAIYAGDTDSSSQNIDNSDANNNNNNNNNRPADFATTSNSSQNSTSDVNMTSNSTANNDLLPQQNRTDISDDNELISDDIGSSANRIDANEDDAEDDDDDDVLDHVNDDDDDEEDEGEDDNSIMTSSKHIQPSTSHLIDYQSLLHEKTTTSHNELSSIAYYTGHDHTSTSIIGNTTASNVQQSTSFQIQSEPSDSIDDS